MPTFIEITAPAEQTEGTRLQVLRWLKAIGDTVSDQEPLLEIETDKVTVELPAPGTGVLREIIKAAQEEVVPGELLGRIEVAAAPATAVPPEGAVQRHSDQATGEHEVRPELSIDRSAAESLSPSVRRLLKQHGFDPEEIFGTGTHGRITAHDVIAHAQTVPSGAGRGGEQSVVSTPTESGEPTRVPHSLMRRTIASRMVESLLQKAPHVTTVFEADLAAVVAHRTRHRAKFGEAGAPLTLTAYFLAACVAAIRAVPETNARWTDDALEIFSTINIGVATALEKKGLVVPVVRDVATLDLLGIARKLSELTARARADRIKPEDVQGGTFTISNHGVSGSLVAMPIIINQPQSAILGIGKLEKRVVVLEQDGAEVIAIRPRCYVSLTLDHRVMDGNRANQFLTVFVEKLEHWDA
jgi:2-oxoglutarate dehydrogenase E2 component (dihydrolipoamide succinyltransferase)